MILFLYYNLNALFLFQVLFQVFLFKIFTYSFKKLAYHFAGVFYDILFSASCIFAMVFVSCKDLFIYLKQCKGERDSRTQINIERFFFSSILITK